MKKLFVFIIFVFLVPNIVFASSFDITSKYVILYNLNDDEVLFEQDSNKQTSIASLTKMMTALVAIENIDDFDELVTITNEDFLGTSGYSKAGFSVGDNVTYEDLLYGILLPSGADAVNAIVNNTLGYDSFVTEMNNLADQIGLSNTSFSNPIGKDDEDNYSTASDIAILLKYALKNETFKKIFTTKEYTTSNGLVLESTLYPYKDILEVDKIAGSKSGFTKDAGRCLASIATLNGVDYLLVVINASTDQNYSAVLDSLTIYDYYNENYSYQQVLSTNDVIKTIPVKWSKDKTYNITGPENVELYLENNTAENLSITYDGIEQIDAFTKSGTKLGTITISDGDEVLYTAAVTLDSDITYYNPIVIAVGIIILLFIILWIFKKIRRKRRRRKKR